MMCNLCHEDATQARSSIVVATLAVAQEASSYETRTG
jgi:hypothetical protein